METFFVDKAEHRDLLTAKKPFPAGKSFVQIGRGERI
jgi:hypothetical protein